MLNDFEKFIYNKHLSCYKKNNNKPYNLRKDFSDLDDSTVFYVKKLSLFFNKFKKINIDDFFNAPYKIYKDEKFFDLKYFISPKAIKAYNLYKNQNESCNPDSEDCLKYTLDSIKFIKQFCKENNISVLNYLDYTKNDETLPSFITHLQEHKINLYTVMGYTNAVAKLNKHFETYKFILGNILENTDNIYNNFIRSKKLKILVREGLKKIA